MTTLCDSWDSNWMDGPCAFDDASSPDDDKNDADAFEAVLQPLPTWDRVPCPNTTNGNIESSNSDVDLGAASRRRRAREWAINASHFWPEDQDLVMNDPGMNFFEGGKDKPGGCASTDSSLLLANKTVANPDMTLRSPKLQPWVIRHSASPKPRQPGHVSETEGTLTHVIRLHRTGSVVVERKGSPSAPGDAADHAGAVGLGQYSGGSDYYAEEERFWQERCPADCATTTAACGISDAEILTNSTKTPSVGSRRDTRLAGEASYDYSRAEVAYRPSAPDSATHHLGGPNLYDNDGTAREGGESRRQRTHRTRFEEEGYSLNGTGESSPQLQPPRRQETTDTHGVRADRVETRKSKAQRRRSRLLRDTENVLHGVLESMTCAAPTQDVFAGDDEDIRARKIAEESSSPSGSTPCERRASALHQRVDDIFRGDLNSKGKTRLPSYEIDGIKPRQRRQARRFPHDNDRYNDHDDCEQDDRDGQSPRRDKQSPLECSRRVIAGAGFGGGRATAGADLQTRPGVAGAVEVGDDDGEEVSAGRVAELGRRIAVRCLHVEQECFRRERAQTRLFQEQLCGARQAAQDAARRIVRDERSRSKRVLTDMQKRFEGRERELVEKLEQAEEGWKTEREALSAAAAAAKSEVDRVRRQAKEAAETGRKDAEKAMEQQRLDLQRGWAEEKGGLRRSAEDALRRAVEGNARAEEKAALEAKTVQESLSAQVRSWKAKAEAAERRALEERDKRRGLEAGAKGALAQEVDQARHEQESVLRDLRTKAEGDRIAHANEIERLEETHRVNLLRVHGEKKKLSEAARRRWQQDMQEVRAEAAARAEDAATRAAAERAEALRRLRLAHDAEMRKAGRDILRLERDLRLCQQEGPTTVVTRSKSDAPLSPLPLGSYSPKPLLSQVEPQTTPLPVRDSFDTTEDPIGKRDEG